jgi:ubiquinol-cytochrome c reductase cytochrome c1 subunit
MKYILIFIVFFVSTFSFAEEEVAVALEKAPIDHSDHKSIKRGAKFFSTTCMACHTLIYMRYNKLAQDAGVTYEKMPVKITTWPLGVKPPDLSLEVSRRGADWVYTYLHSFYLDPARPTGANNLLVPQTAMPGIIMSFQGQQVRV